VILGVLNLIWGSSQQSQDARAKITRGQSRNWGLGWTWSNGLNQSVLHKPFDWRDGQVKHVQLSISGTTIYSTFENMPETTCLRGSGFGPALYALVGDIYSA